MRLRRIHRGSVALISCILFAAAAPSVASAASYAFDTSEASFDASYLQSTIKMTGKVVDGAGKPLVGATVSVIAFGEGAPNAGASAVTDGSGVFTIAGLRRRSVLLKVTLAGWYTEIVPVDLQRPLAETSTSAGDVRMTATKAGRARLIFVGDTMFGRRFTDADEDGIEGEAGDLIRPSSRSSDAKNIVTYVRDALSAGDLATANLECAVTDDPATPHPYKAYTFFSYPATLDGLTYAGVDVVDLANNHDFDYMSAGVMDTIDAVSDTPLEWTGAEMDESSAANTTVRLAPGGVPVSLQGFSTIVKDGSSLTKYLLVARDPDKPGALEASDANLNEFLDGEVGTRFAVPMIHGGEEYSSYPTDTMRSIFVDLIGQGAGMVVAHHTHTAQGIGLVDAGAGPRFVLISLGNFIFDQSTFETWQSMIAVADVDAMSGGKFDVARLQLIPVHVERYVPKLLAGGWMTRAARHFGHLSSTLPKFPSGSQIADGLTGAVVFPAGHRVVALRSSSQYTMTNKDEALTLPVNSGATGVVEFARQGAADSLSRVQTSASAQVEYGREILLYGDFEDLDVDGAFHEGSMWETSESRYLQNSVVRSGIGAAVLLRKSSNDSSTTLYNYRNVPVTGGANLTVRGWVRGDNAGTFKVTTTTYESDGDTISSVERYAKSSGTYGWTRFSVDFTVPSNAADLRINLRHYPPAGGEGRVFVDDLAVVQWTKGGDASAGLSLPTPNAYDYVRFSAIGKIASLGATLTHRTYALP